MKPASHAVAPVQPIPPHWPYCATVPALWLCVGAGALVFGADGVALLLLLDGAAGTEDGAAGTEVGAGAPGGAVVGTVAGCPAVFQVAVVGHAVVATAGEVVPKGEGPGTMRRKYHVSSLVCAVRRTKNALV